MDLLSSVAQAMQSVLTTQAEQAARASGFCQRQSPLSRTFVPAMTFACLGHPLPTLDNFCQAAAACGAAVQPQAFDDRFGPQSGPRSAEYLRLSLANAVREVIAEVPLAEGLLARFTAVAIQDGSTVVLPDCLESLWQGNGGNSDSNTRAAVKLQVRLDLRSGRMSGPFLSAGRASDNTCVLQGDDELAAGSLRIADLGYFNLDEFDRLDRRGVYYASRYQYGTALFGGREQRLDFDQRLDLVKWLSQQSAAIVDVPVKIGCKHRLKGRLVAIRVPEEVAEVRRQRLCENAKKKGKTVTAERLKLCSWTLLLTNIPVEMASAEELAALMRVRWQIELLFKLWKSGNGLDKSGSDKPYRVLCEVYAKLIAVVVQHWVLVAGCWKQSRRSLSKAAGVVRQQALGLAGALAELSLLVYVLGVTVRAMSAGTRMHRSKNDPRTWQLIQTQAHPGSPHQHSPPTDHTTQNNNLCGVQLS